MIGRLKPIFLCADSSLLFWRDGGELFLDRVRGELGEAPKAAYIGASNGDQPGYYNIFAMAMESIGITNHLMVHSLIADAERVFLKQSTLILLAGGDVVRGWNLFVENGLDDLIRKKYLDGAVLMGVSAGAVQLGMCGYPEEASAVDRLVDTFRLIPLIIGAHEEKEDWARLKGAMTLMGSKARAIGIPAGGGMIYHPNNCLESIRHPLYEFSMTKGELSCDLLFPSDPDQVLNATQIH